MPLDGFIYKIGGIQIQRLDGQIHVAMAGDDDDLSRRVNLLDPF
jgi:hypothetical protein